MYIDIATAQQPKRKKKKELFLKKRMNCVMFTGTAFKRLKLELFFWMSKGFSWRNHILHNMYSSTSGLHRKCTLRF